MRPSVYDLDSNGAGGRSGPPVVVLVVSLLLLSLLPAASAVGTGPFGPGTTSVEGGSFGAWLDPAADGGIGAATFLQSGPNATLDVEPTSAHPDATVTFDATGSTAPAGDPIQQCTFDVDGDGTDDAVRDSCRLEYRYATVGEFVATVRVSTESGATATASHNVTVRENDAPTAAADISPTRPRTGADVELSAAGSSDSDGRIVAYDWRVDGVRYAGESAVHRFETSGEYRIALNVTDDDGARTTITRTIAVQDNQEPVASLAVRPATPGVGEQVRLDASGSADADGRIVAYRWDVDGDGRTDRRTTTPAISVSFETAGDREIGVTVVDDGAATNGTTRSVVVSAGMSTEADENASDATGTTVSAGGPGQTRVTGIGVVDALDFGIVPFVPDWLFLAVIVLGVAGFVTVRRRDAVRARVETVRERIHTGEFRRTVAGKATGFVAKSIVKKALRRGADAVEFVANGVGDAVEGFGRAIKGGGQRLASFLRRLGG